MTADGSFSSLLTRQMTTSLKEVSAAALSSVGRWLANTVATDTLAMSPNIAATARNWASIVAEATLDVSQVLAAAAFDAAK